MDRIKLIDTLTDTQKYFTRPFGNLSSASENSSTTVTPPSTSPQWGMSLRAAGSMRFRWNETNPNRDEFFKSLSSMHNTPAVQTGNAISKGDVFTLTPVPVQLDHTKIVYDVKSDFDTFGKIGDGVITKNKSLIPTVTVADCMPIFLFDPITEVFGIVHSGWKGTGIIGEAIQLAKKKYGSKPSDFRIVLGPHIHDCCYIVDEERAKYFMENFCYDCVKKIEDGEPLPKFAWNNGNGSLYRLSFEKANLSVLEKIGVSDENITVCDDCTACNTIYGSNRRETATAKGETHITITNSANKETPNHKTNSQSIGEIQPFTVMAAFVIW